MRGVQIDRDYFAGVGSEIREDIAPATGNRCNTVAGMNRERLHIDNRIFPNLRVNEAFEGKCESPVEQLLFALPGFPNNSFADFAVFDDAGFESVQLRPPVCLGTELGFSCDSPVKFTLRFCAIHRGVGCPINVAT